MRGWVDAPLTWHRILRGRAVGRRSVPALAPCTRSGRRLRVMNLGLAQQAIAARTPDRECIVTPSRRLTYAQVAEHARRLGNVLAAHGLGCHRERGELQNHESGQDHVGIYMLNCPEYIEGMLGAY